MGNELPIRRDGDVTYREPSAPDRRGAKVVYNAGYGGYSLSWDGANELVRELNDRGRNADAATLVFAMGAERAADGDSSLARHYCYCAGRMIRRHDPALVAVVERLGKAAGGRFATLAIREISGGSYRLDEYDGLETVVEPDGVEWVDARDVVMGVDG
jgi:hypothetical protein